MLINLKFKQANDEGIKKYLAAKLKEEKDKNSELNNKMNNMENGLYQTANDREQIHIEMQQLREENRRILDVQEHKVAQIKIEEHKKINEVKEKMLLEASEKQARFDKEKSDLMSKHERDTKQLTDKLDKLTLDYTELSQSKLALETDYKEFQQNTKINNIEHTQRIASLSHELEIVTNQLNELREANKNLDSTKYT